MSETMYLVHSGGDGYRAEIVPESELETAYLAIQFGDPQSITPDERSAALERFQDDDEWVHECDSGAGDRIKFSEIFEDGWVEVIRLPGGLCYGA